MLDIHYFIKIKQIIIRNKSKEQLKLIAHPVDLLDVGEDHLGVYPPLFHHPRHVLGSQEVRHSGKLLSCRECELKVLLSVCRTAGLERSEVECIGEEIVDKCTESPTVSPGLGKILKLENNVRNAP